MGLLRSLTHSRKNYKNFSQRLKNQQKAQTLKVQLVEKSCKTLLKIRIKHLMELNNLFIPRNLLHNIILLSIKKYLLVKRYENLATFLKKLLTRKSADVLNTPKSANAKNTKAQQKLLKNDRKHIKKLQIKAAEAWNKFQETHTKMDFMIVTSLSSQLVKALDDYSVRSRKKLSDKKRMLKEYTNSNLKKSGGGTLFSAPKFSSRFKRDIFAMDIRLYKLRDNRTNVKKNGKFFGYCKRLKTAQHAYFKKTRSIRDEVGRVCEQRIW